MQALNAAIDALHTAEHDAGAGAALLDQVATLRRQIDRLEAIWSRQVHSVHVTGAANAEGYSTTAAFLRHVCHLSPGGARTRIDVADQTEQRPALAQAFVNGEISYAHVKIITEALRPLPALLQTDAEPVLLQAARDYDPTRLTQIARRLRHIIDPDGQAGVDERHREDRWLEITTTFDGNASLRGILDPESAATVRTAIDAMSTRAGDLDPRTPAQRRADALVELARTTLDSGTLPEIGGERPHVTVLVDLATLQAQAALQEQAALQGHAAFQEQAALQLEATRPRQAGQQNQPQPPARWPADPTSPTPHPPTGHPPATLADGEPISIPTARRLSCDAILTRVVTHPTPTSGARPLAALYLNALPPPLRGPTQVLDVGRSSRLATTTIRKALTIRDGGCVMPGCDRPPSRCEAHHDIHWADGGPTALWNMYLLCLFHHHYVHQHNLHIQLNPDGTIHIAPRLADTA